MVSQSEVEPMMMPTSGVEAFAVVMGGTYATVTWAEVRAEKFEEMSLNCHEGKPRVAPVGLWGQSEDEFASDRNAGSSTS